MEVAITGQGSILRPKLVPTDEWPYGQTQITKRYLSALSPALGNTVLIKRAAVEAEWPLTQSVDYWKNTLPVQRLRNEAASIQFIRQHTSIPVPNVVAAFADFDTYYVIQEKVQGVTSVDNVPAEHMHIITTQIDGFIEQMQRLRSPRFGGPGGDVCVPARFGVKDPRSVAALKFRENPANSFVFCHGDLNATNILIDPETYEIKCIIDWEYAGFYPPELEGRWWTRPGPAQPIGDERNDTQELLELLFGLATEESAAEARTWAEIGMRDLEKERQRFLDTQVPAVPKLAVFRDRPSHPLWEIDSLLLSAYRNLSACYRGTPLPEPIVVTDKATTGTEAILTDPESLLEVEAKREKARNFALWKKFNSNLLELTMVSRRLLPGMREKQDKAIAREHKGTTLRVKSGKNDGQHAQPRGPAAPISKQSTNLAGVSGKDRHLETSQNPNLPTTVPTEGL